MTMVELVKLAVVREHKEKQEAKRWEADYVLRAEADAQHDYEAYLRYQKEQGFI